MIAAGIRCPSLAELPPSPAGRTGWPWTEETPRADPDAGAQPWPKISIITPSLNRARYVEEALRSILLQGYPNLELIVIDGASHDGTVDILKRYSRWFTYWVSEPDRCNTHAMNKGLAQATGDIVSIIPSDDRLEPGALAAVAAAARARPAQIIAGDYYVFDDATGERMRHRQAHLEFARVVKFWDWQFDWNSVACFLPGDVVRVVGCYDETIPIVCDYEHFCRLLQQATVTYISTPLISLRLHANALTSGVHRDRIMLGFAKTARRFLSELPPQDVAAYRRIVAQRLFAIGLEHLKIADTAALQFFGAAFRVSPVHAVVPFIRYRLRRLAGAAR